MGFCYKFHRPKDPDTIVGIRATDADEELGLDKAEIGVEAYPDFK